MQKGFASQIVHKACGGFVFLTSYTIVGARPCFSSRTPNWFGHIYTSGWLICQSRSEVTELMSHEIWFKSRCTQKVACRFSGCCQMSGAALWMVFDTLAGCKFDAGSLKIFCAEEINGGESRFKGADDFKCNFSRTLQVLIESRRSLEFKLPRHECALLLRRRSQLVLMLALRWPLKSL